MAPNTPAQEWEFQRMPDGTYSLTENGTTVSITVSEDNWPNSRSTYFDEYNVSAYLNSTPDGLDMDWIKNYAQFYLQLKKMRTQLHVWTWSSMERRWFFNKLSWTTLWLVSLWTLWFSIYENSISLALLLLIPAWLAADDIKKGKFQEFMSFFQRTYPKFFEENAKDSMSYIGSQDSFLPPSVQIMILSIIKTKTWIEGILRNELGYLAELWTRIKRTFPSAK